MDESRRKSAWIKKFGFQKLEEKNKRNFFFLNYREPIG